MVVPVLGFLALVAPLQALQSEAWLHAAQACVLAGAFVYLAAANRLLDEHFDTLARKDCAHA